MQHGWSSLLDSDNKMKVLPIINEVQETTSKLYHTYMQADKNLQHVLVPTYDSVCDQVIARTY